MRTPTLYLLAIVTTMLGCSSKTDTVVTPPVSSVNTTPSVDDLEVNVSEGTEITLTPENTKIEFIGTHVGPDPDPNARTGHFAELAGTALIADDDIQSIQIEIQTASVSTPIASHSSRPAQG